MSRLKVEGILRMVAASALFTMLAALPGPLHVAGSMHLSGPFNPFTEHVGRGHLTLRLPAPSGTEIGNAITLTKGN